MVNLKKISIGNNQVWKFVIKQRKFVFFYSYIRNNKAAVSKNHFGMI